eukprot:m.25013 g.25013  ORF g.25013 m.25013 type:complete len:291 (-) comp5721_c1_seq1:60-932(-)
MVVFAVHGPSCSGKTTVCKNLEEKINAKVLCQDEFYQYAPEQLKKVMVKGVEELDFDCKDSISEKAFKEKMMKLKEESKGKDEEEVVLVEGTMLASFDWLHEFVDVWVLLASDKEDCTARRRKRVYTYPESPDYFPHHAYPASEKMKWDFVQTKGEDHTAYICHMHGDQQDCMDRMVQIINSHVETPFEDTAIHVQSQSLEDEPTTDSSEASVNDNCDLAHVTTKTKTTTSVDKESCKETTITTITESTDRGLHHHTLKTTVISSHVNDSKDDNKPEESEGVVEDITDAK